MDPGFHVKLPWSDPEAPYLLAAAEADGSGVCVGVGSGSGVRVRLNHCRTCNILRPPRASHCRICDRCVETKDHHCPWLRNCIGRRNHRYFVAFLAVALAHVVVQAAFLVAFLVLRRASTGSWPWLTALLLALLDAPAIWAVSHLFAFHARYVASALATKEDMELEPDHALRSLPSNPYSAGSCARNWLATLAGPVFPAFTVWHNFQLVPVEVRVGTAATLSSILASSTNASDDPSSASLSGPPSDVNIEVSLVTKL